jgi:16S rRNA G527 N7-methylase RsmG
VKPDEIDILTRAARWAGVTPDDTQLTLLDRYRVWLEDEAMPGGAIGPNEGPRLVERHLADAICLGYGIDPQVSQLLDVGSGAGLPGIPLAITHPESQVLLLERSGRRVDLLRRVVRILDLENVEVIAGDFGRWTGAVPAIVSRATLTPEMAASFMRAHLSPGGVGVVGGSWETRPGVDGFNTIEVPAEILDQTVWILIMRQT